MPDRRLRTETVRPSRSPVPRSRLLVLLGMGAISWTIYAIVTWVSGAFDYSRPGTERPIVEVLGLFSVAFACYLLALRTAIRLPDRRELVGVIVVFAAGFRAVLVFSQPIQEIDFYRYIWDGAVASRGISPYRYSPQQILASRAGRHLPDDLSRLVKLRDSSESLHTILSRIHYAELPTIYPPVSQAVFAMAARSVPADSSVATYVIAMKAWILLFDMGTLVVLIRILQATARPVGWSLAYGWCPLVLKEFANSGHLDAIAVCLTALCMFTALVSLYGGRRLAAGDLRPGLRGQTIGVLAGGFFLALAVGAKLFPAVLAPMLFVAAGRHLGWKRNAAATLLFLLVTALVCLPMLQRPDAAESSRGGSKTVRGGGAASKEAAEERRDQGIALCGAPRPHFLPGYKTTHNDELVVHEVDAASLAPPHPLEIVDLRAPEPGQGLRAFASRWEMNDFLFTLLVENLRFTTNSPNEPRPWFVVVPQTWRRGLERRLAQTLQVGPAQLAPIAARVVCGLVFVVLAAWFALRAFRAEEGSAFLRAAFLTLAWFWLLLPTQNPWYWTWALPFIPFARCRAWLALGGLLFLYYLRFWFAYHWPASPVWSTPYNGERFFDYVVIWFEYAPWLIWLAAEYAVRRRAEPVSQVHGCASRPA